MASYEALGTKSSSSNAPSKEVVDQLIQLVKQGDVKSLQDILQQNPNYVNIRFVYIAWFNSTLLHVSAWEGVLNSINLLLQFNADINAVDDAGSTPLQLAVCNGKFAAVKLLCERGADINITNNDGQTALYDAAYSGEVDTITFLLKKGLNVNQVDNSGNTPLHRAAGNGKFAAIKLLLDRGADINITNWAGETALHDAAFDGDVDVITFLIKNGSNINQVDNNGNTPLHTAAYYGENKAVKVLKGHGADIYITNKEGKTPLLTAVKEKENTVVRYLIKTCKMDITQLDQETQSKITKILEEEISSSESEDSSTEGEDDHKLSSDAESDVHETEEEMKQAYSLALKDGEAQSSSVSIYVLGQESAGKTCLVASLLGDEFVENTATKGADIDICTIFASRWSRVEKKKIPKQLQMLYHCKLKKTAEIKITAERKVPALKAQNKQQLLESLPELPKAVKADLEQAKAAVLIDEDGINAIIWDFAGQSVYYGLHSMFLKEDNVAMIVFDASQDLQDPTKGRSSRKDPYTQKSINPTTTGCESVCYWLKSIHSICRNDGTVLGAKSKFVPTVFLVATHIDLIGGKEAITKKRKAIIDQLFLALKGKPFAKHLAGIEHGLREALERNCFFISNKIRDQKELDRLRFLLVEASKYIVNKQHPVVYLNIERHLLSLTKMVISTGEFYSIAYDSGFFALPQSAEFKGALVHFHRKGTILHFPQAESLKDMVVLSPDWLTKLFAYVIVAHPYKYGLDYDVQFERLTNQGILEEDFIAYMVDKFNKEQEKFGLPLTSKQAIEFAKLFGFIIKVNSNTYFLEEDDQPPSSENQVFIVPPMLPLKPPDDVQLPKDNDPQSRIVYFKFSEGFIPLMIYYQMLGVCIDRNIQHGDDLYWIRRHVIKLVLGHDQLYFVSLCEDLDSIRLAIAPDEDVAVTSQGLQERWKLIEDFNTKLKETVKTFMPASDAPQRYVPCSRCSKLHLKLDDIRKSSQPLHCVRGRLAEDYYSDLRKYEEFAMPDEAVIAGGFELIAKKVPRIKKLVSYLKKVKNWETFGYLLLPDEQEDLVEEIKVDNEGKGVNSCKIALYRAFIKCGIKTWETVVTALEGSDNVNIAKEVKKQLVKDYLVNL